LLESSEKEIIDLKDSIRVPIIAVLTKYDKLVDSLMPPKEEEEDLYGDIEEAIGMNDDVDCSADLETLAAEAPPVDPDILSHADSKLSEEFVQAESGLKDVPWVGVSVWPNYTHKLDELVKITLDNIDQSVRLLWAITQQQSADLKIHASTKIGKQRKRKYCARKFQGINEPVKRLLARSIHGPPTARTLLGSMAEGSSP